MKFFFTFFVLIGLFSFFQPSESYAIRENKIIRVGYVNYSKLLQKLDQDGEIQKQIDRLKSSSKEKIDDLSAEVQRLQDDISSNPDSDSINQKIQEFEEKSLNLSLLKIRTTQDIEKTTNTLLQKFNDKIKPAIQNIAKRQHFDVIIDSSLILVASPSLDITNFVLASL